MRNDGGMVSEQKYLFHRGENSRCYDFFGAHPSGSCVDDGITFRVWAPRAVSVSLVGDFNDWDPAADPMTRMEDDESIWELNSTRIRVGDLYKFAVTSDKGKTVFKADPFAFETEKGSPDEGHHRASRVSDIGYFYKWSDQEWMEKRGRKNHYRMPMNIYEVHFGSWRRHEDDEYLTYREMAEQLIPYVKEMGYTHIELLPLTEYPFDGSWGYQVTGYYSITSRYGTPEDFKFFVDQVHQNGLGLIMDWVPAHFPKDEHGLIEFDGYPLYEDPDPLKMEHKGWGTRAFDFGRKEVLSFLISNAFFFCDVYHIDGLRVDAVAAMLYLDYDRGDGEWRPNRSGGRENPDAVHFLQKMNQTVLTEHPGVVMIAEESTAWPNVTRPPSVGGLGFNFKWNMGWMNDTLEYFSSDPFFRGGMHNKLTFSMTYAYSENFILPVSHDEVVHGKCSMIGKMPGSYEDKFAGLRAFYIYMMTHPGKKLTFMGSEFAQFIEWNEKQALDWVLLDYEKHRQMQTFIKELNRFYLTHSAMWQADDSMDGFRWIDADNSSANTYIYYRSDGAGENPEIEVVALNLSGTSFDVFDFGVPEADSYTCVFDSDSIEFGGQGVRKKQVYKVKKGERNGYPQYITAALPPLSGIILERNKVTEVRK